MFIKENIMLAIAGLKANKMRALLTMLGIIIGIASVIGVVSIGNTMTSSVTSSMASMGVSNITVNVHEKSAADKAAALARKTVTDTSNSNASSKKAEDSQNKEPGNKGGPEESIIHLPAGPPPGGPTPPPGRKGADSSPSDADLMTMEQISVLQKKFNDKIDAISISENGNSGKVKNESTFTNVSVIGTNVGYQEVNAMTIIDGRYFIQNDIDEAKNVAVVSDKLAIKIFGNSVDPIGKKIKFYTSNAIFTYYIVGVYEYQSDGGNRTASDENLSTSLYIPISVEKKAAINKNYQTFTIKAKDNVDIMQFTNEVSKYLVTLYTKNIKFVADANNRENMLQSMNSMLTTVSMAISGIAAISLIVGGIGVMNIMLVSVTERTREIGTRKALGAKGSHIKIQFIVESVIICSIGGIIGIAVGLGAGAVGSKFIGQTLTVSPLVVLISFSFSMFIGVFFGYYPAKKAAELDPIEALRYE